MSILPKHALLPAVFALSFTMGTAQVTVSDFGTSIPTFGANDAGFVGDVIDLDPNSNGTTTVYDNWLTGPAQDGARFGFESGEFFSQSFTLANSLTLSKIFVAYNQFENTDTITIDFTFNNSLLASPFTQTGIVLDGANFSQSTFPGIAWMEFDVSAANLLGAADGSNIFTIEATADNLGGSGFVFAPMYGRDEDYYPDGSMSAGFNAGGLPNSSDLGFVVTTVPEPSAAVVLLGSIFGLAMMRRRR